jgi:hypothetical protein
MFFIIIIFDLPFIAFGWIKPYGMAFEKFIQTAFVSNVVSPSVRKYETKNLYSNKKEEDTKRQRDKKQIEKKIKASKEYIAYK